VAKWAIRHTKRTIDPPWSRRAGGAPLGPPEWLLKRPAAMVARRKMVDMTLYSRAVGCSRTR
jgi:hypothetical protein